MMVWELHELGDDQGRTDWEIGIEGMTGPVHLERTERS